MAVVEESLSLWREALAPECVVSEAAHMRSAETATFATGQSVVAILYPRTVSEVQECVRIANRSGIPLYPISSGKNWGYGSRVPPAGQCAILHLGRLNTICEFNNDLGYVTVEPGVTQGQLFDFLRSSQARWWMDATGSSVDSSLIGNVMERGFGHTPLGDRFAHVCALHVVLPSGELVETGFGRFRNSQTAAVSRWGVGPSLDGLFSQSNLGIVVRMTIWLMRTPPGFEAFFFRLPDQDNLPALVDTLRELRLRDILRSSIHIGNDYKVLAGLQQYPWSDMAGSTPLTPAIMAEFRQKLGFGSWNVSGALYGTKTQIREARSELRRALRPIRGSLKFLSQAKLQFAKRFARPFRLVSGWDLRRTVELVEPILGLMQGRPTNHSLASAYWRKKSPIPTDMNPDRDRCGLLWYAPVAPALGTNVRELTNEVSRRLLQFGFEPQLSLTFLTPRTVSCIISISYDREVAGEDERAYECYKTIVEFCSAEGYYPYRLSILGFNNPYDNPQYRALLQNLKTCLDPQNILAPGRYDFTVEPT